MTTTARIELDFPWCPARLLYLPVSNFEQIPELRQLYCGFAFTVPG
jgi:hypothetical protein